MSVSPASRGTLPNACVIITACKRGKERKGGRNREGKGGRGGKEEGGRNREGKGGRGREGKGRG